MAEDFDVEAMLEAPYKKHDDISSKHRSDKHGDRHRNSDKDKDGSSRRDRRRSRDRDSTRTRDRDDKDKHKEDKDRHRDDKDRHRDDKDRHRDDKDRHRDDKDRHKDGKDKHREDKDKNRDSKDKYRERDREYREKGKEKEKGISRERSRERLKERSGKEIPEFEKSEGFRSKSRGMETKEEQLPPEERDLRTVFCMQLSQRIKATDLEEFFSSVGKVRDVRLITCNKTRRFKGIAYIEFKDAESVPLALGLTGQKLLGIPIIVQHTQAEKNRMGNTLPNLAPKNNNGPTRLYVGSLHFNITEDMLRGIFEPFGKIDNIQLIIDPDTGKSKGYGFLTYHHAPDAKKALEQLNGFELAGRPMKVGHVTERTDGGPLGTARLDADELDRAGIDLGATGRLQLMFKLAEGTGLQVPQGAASLLMSGGPAPEVAIPPHVAPPIATQCFMLNNMFDPATETNPSWDMEIRDDVIEECNKHGGVLHVYLDKASPQGNVYVKCPTIATAVASVNSLHGRWFAGRVITAAYVPLINYHSLFPDAMTALSLLLPSRRNP